MDKDLQQTNEGITIIAVGKYSDISTQIWALCKIEQYRNSTMSCYHNLVATSKSHRWEFLEQYVAISIL